MNALSQRTPHIAPMTEAALDNVRALEAQQAMEHQVAILTAHTIHGGVYSRTICIPAGCMITGVFIKISTTVIVSGHATLYTGGADDITVCGYQVIPAAAGRKQAIYAHLDTDMTMLFPTAASTVAEAEAAFTDDVASLASHACDNVVVITGE